MARKTRNSTRPTAKDANRPAGRSRLPATLSWGAELLAVALATATVSAMLLRLSGTALWMPPAWRTMMFILVPLGGIFVYTFARHAGRLLRDYCHAKWAPDGRSKKAEAAGKRVMVLARVVTATIAVCAAASALYAGVSINNMREQCTVNFTPPHPVWMNPEELAGYDWYWWEFGRSTPLPTETDRREAILSVDLDPKLPNFLDRRHDVIYVPLVWPEDIRSRIELRGEGSFENGLSFVYENEPRWLIDELRKSEAAAEEYAATQRIFFWAHVAMIGLVALAIGIVFEPAAWLARELTGVIG